MENYDFTRPIHYTVSVFVIDKERVLLLKQSRSQLWLLPGGHVEDNEFPHETAVREVLEETGLQIEVLEKPDDKAGGGKAISMPSPHHIRVLPCRDKKDYDFVFTAKVLAGQLKINDESNEAKWFSLKEILKTENIGPYTKYYAKKILGSNNNDNK